MPRFDGTGPAAQGPLTGRGDGYCAVEQTDTGAVRGVVGLRNRPFFGIGSWLGLLSRPLGLGRGRRSGRRSGGRGRGRW